MKFNIFNLSNICLLLILVLSGCSNSGNNKEEESNIRPLKSSSDLFKKIEVIPLETNDKSLISKADKVLFSNNQWFVLDKSQDKLFIFDNKGYFIRSFKRKGRGKGEYFKLADFNIDSNNNLEILDYYTIKTYDQQFKFISSVRLVENEIAHSFIRVDKDHVLLNHGNGSFNFTLFNTTTQSIKYRKEKSPQKLHNIPGSNSPPSYRINDTIYTRSIYKNVIYRVGLDDFHEKFTLFDGAGPDFSSMPENLNLKEVGNWCSSQKKPHNINFFHNNNIILNRVVGKDRKLISNTGLKIIIGN